VPISGLTDGNTYYAYHSGGGIKLKANKDDASFIDITSTGATGKSHSLVKQGNLPSGDASETGMHSITAGVDASPFRGVAVTATNSDDIAGVGVSAAVSGGASVGVSGTVQIVSSDTTAYIGKFAQVNNDGNVGSNAGQSVKVAAGNAFHELMVSASIAGGTVGVGAGVTVGVQTLNTDAYIDNSAVVIAHKDVFVKA